MKALEEGTTPKAHQTRSISSSWALFTRVGVEDICRAAFWRSANSFTSFYLNGIAASEGVFLHRTSQSSGVLHSFLTVMVALPTFVGAGRSNGRQMYISIEVNHKN